MCRRGVSPLVSCSQVVRVPSDLDSQQQNEDNSTKNTAVPDCSATPERRAFSHLESCALHSFVVGYAGPS